MPALATPKKTCAELKHYIELAWGGNRDVKYFGHVASFVKKCKKNFDIRQT